MRKGDLRLHKGSVAFFIFLLGATLLFSVPEVTDAHPQVLEVEPTNRPLTRLIIAQ